MLIEFDYLYAHERANPAEQRRFYISSGSERVASDATRRTYGGGGSRNTRGRAVTSDVPYALVELTRDDWRWLKARVGETLYWRDPRGRAFDGFAGELDLAEPDVGTGTIVGVSFTVQAVSDGEELVDAVE